MSEKRAERRLSRRALIAGAGAGAAAVAVTGGALAQEDAGQIGAGIAPPPHGFGPVATADTVLNGTVARVEGDRTIWVTAADRSSPVAIDLLPSVVPVRDGPTTLSAFVQGDEVVAQGTWAGDRFQAMSLAPLFRLVEGRVTGRRGDELETTGGDVDLTARTVARGGKASGHELGEKELGKLKRDDEIVAMGFVDGGSNDLVAARVGVIEP